MVHHNRPTSNTKKAVRSMNPNLLARAFLSSLSFLEIPEESGMSSREGNPHSKMLTRSYKDIQVAREVTYLKF